MMMSLMTLTLVSAMLKVKLAYESITLSQCSIWLWTVDGDTGVSRIIVGSIHSPID